MFCPCQSQFARPWNVQSVRGRANAFGLPEPSPVRVLRISRTDRHSRHSTTNAQGQSVITETTLAGAATTSASPSSIGGGSSTSHLGAIVGGTVGGVAAIALLAGLLLFCLRRQRDKDDFDGNFDPDRVAHGQPGTFDLTGAADVEPYTYPRAGPDMHERQWDPVSQHSLHNAAPGTTHPSTPSDYGSRSPTNTSASVAAYVPSSTTHSQPRSAKEREAFLRYTRSPSVGASGSVGPADGLQVANPRDVSERAGVVVHQDGGRVTIPPDEEAPEREIPPTYDSIPADAARR